MVGRTLLHYELLDELGRGGMGEVYLALDTRLDRKLALKVLAPELSAQADWLERFEREAKTVASINHPNIVTLFSLEQTDGVHFLTMEYIQGETLSGLIPRQGMPLDQLFEIAIPVADALGAAHSRKIIHRDLKPGNIMVTDEGLVKVLDFGLAKEFEHPIYDERTSDPEDETLFEASSLTLAGQVAGTPPYMSPEQWQGGTLDHRSDIFSLGVVIYEMATGNRPFGGASAAELVSSVMRDQPRDVGELRADLPRHLTRVIGHCLEKKPENRIQTAHGLRNQLRALKREVDTGLSPTTSAMESAPPRPISSNKRRPWRLALGAGLLVLAALGAYFGLESWRDRPSGGGVEHAAESRPSVAVLGFQNLGRPEAAWLSTALAEIFSTELASGGNLRLIAGESIARMQHELELPDTSTLAADTLAAIGRSLGTNYVLIGSFLSLPQAGLGGLRIQGLLQDTRSGETVASFSETGSENELFDLVSRTGGLLRQELAVGVASAEASAAARATLSKSAEATRLYSEGLDHLRDYEAVDARDLFEQAIAVDPDYALAHAALARSLVVLGYESDAEVSASLALSLADDLPREDFLAIRGLFHETAGDWSAAVKTYELLWGFYPDSLDHGLRLASAQSSAGLATESLETVEALRRLPPPAGDDPRIDLEEGRAAADVGDYPRWLAASCAAQEKAWARQASVLVADARFLEGSALTRLGRPKEAREALVESRRLFEAAGDRGRAAQCLVHLAILLKYDGELNQAKTLYNEALEIFLEIGYRRRAAEILNNRAIVERQQGDLETAEQAFMESASIAREIGDQHTESAALENVAEVRLYLGRLEEAEGTARGSVAIGQQLADRSLEAWAQVALGKVLTAAGRLAEARRAFEVAERLSGEISYPHLQAYALAGLGRVAGASGEGAAAREFFDASRTLRIEMGEKATLARTELAWAEHDLASGVAEEAAELARRAAEEFSRGGSIDDEAAALGILTRALLAMGRTSEARIAFDATAGYRPRSQNVLVRLKVGIAEALLVAEENPQEALRRLEVIASEARKAGFEGVVFEARLARVGVAVEMGASGSSDAEGLRLLAQEARAAGFLLIANRADALLQSVGLASVSGSSSSPVSVQAPPPAPRRRST